MELELAASTVEVTTTGLVIRWSDGSRSRFHALWLRDNCSSGGGKGSAQRTFSVVDLNPELFVLDAERDEDGDLFVEFSDGHESTFSFDWLRQHSHEPHDRRLRSGRVDHFRSGAALPRFDLPRRGSEHHVQLLDALERHGVVLVDGVPSGDPGSSIVLALVGGAPDTSVDLLEQRESSALELRTAECTRHVPAGLLMFQGGEVGAPFELIVVDGFGVALELQDFEPDAFDLLTHTMVPFIERDALVDSISRVTHAEIIQLDQHRQIAGIRFDETALGPFDIDPSEVGDYYRALIGFVDRLRDPSRGLRVALGPDQVLLVDNHRVLHSGVGAANVLTVGRDEFIDQLRSRSS